MKYVDNNDTVSQGFKRFHSKMKPFMTFCKEHEFKNT